MDNNKSKRLSKNICKKSNQQMCLFKITKQKWCLLPYAISLLYCSNNPNLLFRHLNNTNFSNGFQSLRNSSQHISQHLQKIKNRHPFWNQTIWSDSNKFNLMRKDLCQRSLNGLRVQSIEFKRMVNWYCQRWLN